MFNELFANDLSEALVEFEHFFLLSCGLSERLIFLALCGGVFSASYVGVHIAFLKFFIVRARNKSHGAGPFIHLFDWLSFQLFKRLLSLALHSPHMVSDFQVVFGCLLQNLSKLALIK